MNKALGSVLTIIGTLLICFAVVLLYFNHIEASKAQRTANDTVLELSGLIEKNKPCAAPTSEADAEENQQPAVPNETPIEIAGHNYIGYLSIPSLELMLPVMAEWDYEKLKIAPCRQFGTVYEDNMVIAGHNYQSHFGRLTQLQPEDDIIFTDTTGNEKKYIVKEKEILLPTDVDAVQNSSWALTLYTCTYDGNNRITIRCEAK